MKNLWTCYQVTFSFIDRLCGSVPANPDLTKAWLENRTPTVKPAGGRDEVAETLLKGEQQETTLLCFQRADGQLVMRAGTVKAHIKDCARVISAQAVGKIKGERSFATKVINGVYQDEKQYWLPLLRQNGDPVTEADDTDQKAIHFKLPDGRMLNAIKVFEYINQPVLRFRLKVLGNSPNQEDIEMLFNYGGVHGYGGERGDGEGRYEYKLEKETTDGERDHSTGKSQSAHA